MAISDDKQRIMPTEADRKSGRVLSYPEAVILTDPSNPSLKGEVVALIYVCSQNLNILSFFRALTGVDIDDVIQVDDKYQYSCDNKDNHLHGWISSQPQVGFWVITPSDEFRAGGPMKTDLTSQAGPTSLSVSASLNHQF